MFIINLDVYEVPLLFAGPRALSRVLVYLQQVTRFRHTAAAGRTNPFHTRAELVREGKKKKNKFPGDLRQHRKVKLASVKCIVSGLRVRNKAGEMPTVSTGAVRNRLPPG